tara:strand:+ start:1942 stop:2193 length:252 start_codon:yes stop_codon:yes gene_type:complete
MTEKDKKEDFCLACAAAPALVSAISGAGAAIEAKDASKDTASTNTKKDTIIRDVLIGVSVVSAIVAVVMLLKKNGKKRKKRRR